MNYGEMVFTYQTGTPHSAVDGVSVVRRRLFRCPGPAQTELGRSPVRVGSCSQNEQKGFRLYADDAFAEDALKRGRLCGTITHEHLVVYAGFCLRGNRIGKSNAEKGTN